MRSPSPIWQDIIGFSPGVLPTLIGDTTTTPQIGANNSKKTPSLSTLTQSWVELSLGAPAYQNHRLSVKNNHNGGSGGAVRISRDDMAYATPLRAVAPKDLPGRA